MLDYLVGIEQPTEVKEAHPINSWRRALQGMISAYWTTLGPQIKCPAKDMHTNPNPCFGCLDAQVMVCVAMSKQSERIEDTYFETLKRYK